MIAALALLRRIPTWAYIALAVIAAVITLHAWHNGQLRKARNAGRAEQASIDAKAFNEAARKAEAQQERVIADTVAKAEQITMETTNEIAKERDAIARDYAAIRLRWRRAEANSSRAGKGEAVAVASAAPGFDAAACTARGYVDFQTAATIAEAADVATARDDAWREWWTAQAAAWPK